MSGTLSDAALAAPPGSQKAAPPADATAAANATTTSSKSVATTASAVDASVAQSVGSQSAQAVAANTTQAAGSQGVLVDDGPDSLYNWTFLSLTGDRYSGILYDDSADFYPGQWFASGYGQRFGYYVIEKEFEFGVDLAGLKEGLVFVTSYYDAQTNTTVLPFRVQQGQPSTYNGLGNEYDFALVGGLFVDFGFGGTNLI